MTLTDSGPLVALLLPTDQHHARCVAVLPALSPPMVTSLPCLTEALHFLGRERGWTVQAKLWQLVVDGRLEVRPYTQEDVLRMRALMDKYSDVPMDLADASLVVLAENLNETHVFTLDSHFRAYRLRDRRAFRLTPD